MGQLVVVLGNDAVVGKSICDMYANFALITDNVDFLIAYSSAGIVCYVTCQHIQVSLFPYYQLFLAATLSKHAN